MPELSRESVSVFAPAATAELGARIAAALGLPIGRHEETTFTGEERKLRPLESVRGRSVYVVQTLFGDAQGSANDRLCSLLFFIGALKDAGAKRVSACVPYLAYARQELLVPAPPSRGKIAVPRHETRYRRATPPNCSKRSASIK